MKLVVISDTHGNYPAALRALESISPADVVIHLGDFCDDALPLQAALECKVIRVPGNCDTTARLPRELFIRFAGVPFLLCHGDAYGVKGGLTRLGAHARRIGAEVVLFGHTHSPLVKSDEGILFVNPGSLQKGENAPTFALVTLAEGTVSAQLIPLPNLQTTPLLPCPAERV
jgi:uncharacterized protein